MNGITEGLVAAAATMTIVSQTRSWRAGSELKGRAKQLEEYTGKVRDHAVKILGLLHEAAYQAQEQANLREELRVKRELPEEITRPMPSLRPRTAAQKAKAARAARAGNKG